MPLLSDLYNVTLKRGIRGKAAEGFIRPTIGQSFMSDRDFKETPSTRYLNIIFPNGNEITKESGKVSLSNPGEYVLTVTNNIPITCKLWGAGGGYYGGVGGYTYGELILTVGTIYKVWVGGGGKKSTYGALGGFGGGGLCGSSNDRDTYVGSGGGLTGIFSNQPTLENSIIIAGGGGGGIKTYWAGNGGGSIGGRNYVGGGYYGAEGYGYGGTQNNGGQKGIDVSSNYHAGATDGSALKGGDGATSTGTKYSGGGGGGGYYGGGAGGAGNYVGRPGGGGSGFIHPSIINNGQTLKLQEYAGDVPNNTDLDYINNAGMPTTTNGNGGLFVISIIS